MVVQQPFEVDDALDCSCGLDVECLCVVEESEMKILHVITSLRTGGAR